MRLLVSILIALFFYIRTDILIWQRIFETNQLWQYAGVYHRGWYMSLYGFILLGVLLLPTWREKLFYGITLLILCFNGTNDVLYYWLDGRALPERLEWLDRHFLILFSPVTRGTLLLNCALWIVAIFFLQRRLT